MGHQKLRGRTSDSSTSALTCKIPQCVFLPVYTTRLLTVNDSWWSS